jgi:hypothetical protein
MHKLAIEYRHPSSLKAATRNARKHSKRQLRLIAKSIESFGFNAPVLIEADGTIIAGHGRVEAAKLLELTNVPAVRIEHLTPEEKRAYMLADNRIAELSTWDDSLLAEEIAELLKADLDSTSTRPALPWLTLTGSLVSRSVMSLKPHLTSETTRQRGLLNKAEVLISADKDPSPDVLRTPTGAVFSRSLLFSKVRVCRYTIARRGTGADSRFPDPDQHLLSLGVQQHSR